MPDPSGGGVTANDDELDLVLGQDLQQARKVDHDNRRASRPARRTSSKNRTTDWSRIILSSTLSFIFSRRSVRSTPGLNASITGSGKSGVFGISDIPDPSRGDWTPIELFLQAAEDLESPIKRLIEIVLATEAWCRPNALILTVE